MSGWGYWDASWTWSLLLFAVTIAVHAVGVVLIARGLVWYRKRRPKSTGDFLDTVPESISIIVVVALILSMLHALESTIWAVVFVYLGAFHSVADAMLYSVDSMTTRGSSGLDMNPKWGMMGATESGNGMLLFGISTAFLFAVMVGLWKKRTDD